MSTTIEVAELADSSVQVAGIVSTAPILIRSLPDRVPHVAFHIDTPTGPGFNVHVDGPVAERAQRSIHRHDRVTVAVRRVYRTKSDQITPDVDASAITVDVH